MWLASLPQIYINTLRSSSIYFAAFQLNAAQLEEKEKNFIFFLFFKHTRVMSSRRKNEKKIFNELLFSRWNLNWVRCKTSVKGDRFQLNLISQSFKSRSCPRCFKIFPQFLNATLSPLTRIIIIIHNIIRKVLIFPPNKGSISSTHVYIKNFITRCLKAIFVR